MIVYKRAMHKEGEGRRDGGRLRREGEGER